MHVALESDTIQTMLRADMCANEAYSAYHLFVVNHARQCACPWWQPFESYSSLTQMEGLRQCCQHQLLTEITSNTVLKLADVADALDDKSMKGAVLKFWAEDSHRYLCTAT